MPGRSFVAIIIIITLSVFLLRIAIEQIIRINISQNESLALTTLKSISTALENYARDNENSFPAGLSVLTQSMPAYLDRDYITESPIKGYNYTCLRLDALGYSCSAVPVKCKLTGKIIYNIITGGSLVSQDCGTTE
jgi:hypothetical protein